MRCLLFTRRGLAVYGGLEGIRDENALRSAIAAVEQAYHYGDKDPFMLAARYAFHISEAQGFVDGNKRAALGAALVFLDANGYDWTGAASDDLADAIIGLSDGSVTKEGLAQKLRALCGGVE